MLTLTKAQAQAIESLGCEGENRTPVIMALLVERNELLKSLIRAFEPEFHYEMGRVGYH